MENTVCFFNTCKTWGGGEKWHLDMAVRLSRQGTPVVVGVYPGSELARRLSAYDIPRFEIRVSNLSFLNPLKIWKIRRWLKKLGVTRIILNLPSDLKAAGIAAALAGVSKVIYRRGSAIPIRNSMLNRFLFRSVVDCVVANSDATKRTLLQHNQRLIPAENIHVIYNGIDLAAFDRSKSAPSYRTPGGEVVLGTAGRLEPEKNHRFMIEVAAKLKQRSIPFKLLIAGKGRLEASLQKIARQRGLQEEVVFVGFVENIRGFMKSLDIFLLSSLWEGFGYVLIEAMASELPVIAFDTASEPEIVEHQKTGFVVEAGDLNGFVEKIEILVNNKSMALEFGKRGRQRVKEKFEICATLNSLKRTLSE